MKKIFLPILLAGAAALSSCVVDEGGNRNLSAYQLRQLSESLVEQSVSTSVSAINQMARDGRDINADGFTARASDGILIVRTDQDCWDVTGQNETVTFSLTIVRQAAADGYDSWTCRDVQCLHDEGASGFARLVADGDIVFEWITITSATYVNSRLEQTGLYEVEFFADPRAATCTDWVKLIYAAGDLTWNTSRGGTGDHFYYE